MTVREVTGTDTPRLVRRVVDRVLDDEEARALAARAVWACLVEPGDGVAGRLLAAAGPEAALHEIHSGGRDGLAREAAGIEPDEWRKALARWRPRLVPDAARAALEIAARAGVRMITPEDPRWPVLLDDLGDHAPLCLWVRGEPGALTATPAVAVVGARAASGYGEHVALEISADLVARGVCIVSGAAYGIDGTAHRAALTAGGTTIALLAGGVDRPYPAGHASLIDRMTVHGAVASEVPCGGAPTKWRFLQRNRLIAALSHATVVVEAGWRSGSLNTAGHAAMLGRPLGAVPGPVTSAASAGCHRLLRDYDARCITGADDVMELLGVPGASCAERGIAPRIDDTTRVLDALSTRSSRTPEAVAGTAGLSIGDVEATLGLLAVSGRAVRVETGWKRASMSAPPRPADRRAPGEP